MINSSLMKLLRLRAKGSFKRTLLGLRSPKRAVFTIIAALMFMLWIIPQLFVASRPHETNVDAVIAIMPLGIMGITLLNLLSAAKDVAVKFDPNEIDFLFAGPFSRRELMVYKLIDKMRGILFSSFIFTIISFQFIHSGPKVFGGMFLLFLFITLLDIAVVLFKQNLDFFKKARTAFWIFIAVGLVSFAVSVMGASPPESTMDLVRRFHQHWFGGLALAPFKPFTYMIAAQAFFPDWLMWTALSGLICAALFWIILLLDENFIEVSLNASRRFQERRMKAVSGGFLGGHAKNRNAARRVPRLPWWFGAGPIAWRQLNEAQRNAGALLRLMIVPIIVIAFSLFPSMMRGGDHFDPTPVVVGVVSFFSIFFTQHIRFDFRSDVDSMEWFKQLPIHSVSISLGQLITPTLILFGMLLLIISTMLLPFGRFDVWIAIMAFLPSGLLLLFEIENFIFLLFPFRIDPVSGADMQLMGRIYAMLLLKVLIAGLCAGAAAGLGALIVWAARTLNPGAINQTAGWLLFGGVAWGVCLICNAIMLLVVAWAFRRFDVSADAPV
ncbi:MAG: hypothetical protein GC154_06755 [bacterium]|nr:hypothetical protein [bacterium]